MIKETEYTVHNLKTDPDVFDMSVEGTKDYEIRFNDRDFQVGDILMLHETVHTGQAISAGFPLEYTGRCLIRRVVSLLSGYGLLNGWVVMQVEDAPDKLTLSREPETNTVREELAGLFSDELELGGSFPDVHAPSRGPDINVANLEAAMAKVMEERDTLLQDKSTLEGYVEEMVNSRVNPSRIIDALLPMQSYCKWVPLEQTPFRYFTSCGLEHAERYEGAKFCERCRRRIAVKVL